MLADEPGWAGVLEVVGVERGVGSAGGEILVGYLSVDGTWIFPATICFKFAVERRGPMEAAGRYGRSPRTTEALVARAASRKPASSLNDAKGPGHEPVLAAYWPRLFGSTSALVRKSTMRKSPRVRAGRLGRQRGSYERYEPGSL
jgi:hypothetical protein